MSIDIIPHDGYWLNNENIKKIENLKNATYMGYWTTKRPSGEWNDLPVDIFYVDNPDTSLGHSNYFGIFYRNDVLYINNGITAFDDVINAIECSDGKIIVSRYRHDYVTHNDSMIDGGRNYTRYSLGLNDKLIDITIDGSEFKKI